MWPATAWDDSDWEGHRARGWTVTQRLRTRQHQMLEARDRARMALREKEHSIGLISALSIENDYKQRLAAQWSGSFAVLAFLFAHPDEPAIKTLARRRTYFDIRTSDTWDLFLPGYFTTNDPSFENHVGSRPVGRRGMAGWYFDPLSFETMRSQIEEYSNSGWRYTGGADLVLVNAYVPAHGEVTVDWDSVQAGSLTPDGPASLQAIVEKITTDLTTDAQDSAYGVASVTRPLPAKSTAARQIMIGAAGEIAASLIGKLLGLDDSS